VTQLGQGLPADPLDRGQLGAQPVRVGVGHDAGGPGGDDHDGDVVGDHVVQLAGDALPLGGGGLWASRSRSAANRRARSCSSAR
jgi:hypothetical protein